MPSFMATTQASREEATRWLIEHNHHGCHIIDGPDPELPLAADVDSLALLLDRAGCRGCAMQPTDKCPRGECPNCGSVEGHRRAQERTPGTAEHLAAAVRQMRDTVMGSASPTHKGFRPMMAALDAYDARDGCAMAAPVASEDSTKPGA